MIDTFRELIRDQYEAAFCALNASIDRCPDTSWEHRIGRYTFGQVAFHALFYADFYLGPNEAALREQPFHRENPEFFGEYEELRPVVPTIMHSKDALRDYLQRCRSKARNAIDSETEEALCAQCDFENRDFTRAELHVYNIRHIQHHVGQLAQRVRIDDVDGVPWVGSAWRDT